MRIRSHKASLNIPENIMNKKVIVLFVCGLIIAITGASLFWFENPESGLIVWCAGAVFIVFAFLLNYLQERNYTI